ncbi:prepilin-type N-terminal cleavage/methylation domain-containing protein [bacterium]|nr:prepilin-type N-terminal cleavage/methylation domain-containing protein [candidate division CSSED10-310 bacterium]
MKRNDAASQQGFTLMELLIAASVVAMLAMGVAAGLSAALRAWESGERNLETYQSKRIVCDRLIAEIGNAINVKGQSDDEEKARMIFNGETDSLSFLTTAHALMSPTVPMALKETNIFVEPGVGLIIYEAMFSSTEFFSRDRGVSYLLDPTITEIRFAYYYIPKPMQRGGQAEEEPEVIDGEWLDTWGPDHIEIKEVSTEEEGSTEQDRSTQLLEREITMNLPLAVEVLITSQNPVTGDFQQWQPLIVPLKESRVLGVSVKRRERQ